MKGKHLDEHIRKALENLEAGYDPYSWSAFEERLDAADTLNNGATDPIEAAAQQLAGTEVPLQPGDWEKMAQRIEAEEAAEIIENEAAIDNLVFEKLNRIEVPLQNSHWHLMAKRLEEEFSLLHKLYRYKVAEVALMALLLLTVIRFAPLAENLLQPRSQDIHTEKKAMPGDQASSQTAPANKPAEAAVQSPTSPTAAAEPSQTHEYLAPDTGQSVAKVENSTKPSTAASSQSNVGISDQRRTTTLSQVQMPQLNPFAAHSRLWEELRAGQSFSFFQDIGDTYATDQVAERLATLPTGPVKPKYAWEVPQVANGITKKESELRFSIFTATDINYVLTPQNKFSVFDTLVSTAPDTSLAFGYGGGILVSWKRDKWEVQTGGIYSFKRYIPNTPDFVIETVNYYVKEEFQAIQLDLLQVPLNLQYHFKNTGKWRFYGNGGLSGHFITASVYEIAREHTPVFKIAAMPPPEGSEVLADNSTIRNEKALPKGLFSGGDFRSNFYLTANVGLGVERYVSNRWSMFFQPNYHHYLLSEGVGTNKDKFYTLSFNLGTKFSMK